MNRTILISALLSALFLTACDKPTVVNVPAEKIIVPGPAGPAGTDGAKGDSGVQGNTGNSGVKGDTGVQGEAGVPGDVGLQGNDGKTGEGTTVIITPPAEATN